MAQVAQAHQSTDEIAVKLKQFFDLLDHSCQQLETIASHIHSGNEALHRSEQTMRSHVNSLDHALQEGEHQLDTVGAETIHRLKELQTAVAHAESKINHETHTIEQAEHQFDSALHERHTHLETSLIHLKQTFSHAIHGFTTLEQLLTDAEHLTHQAFEQGSHSLSGLSHQVETLQSHTIHSFEELSHEVTGNLTHAIDTDFSQFSEMLHRHLNDSIHGLTNFGSHITDAHSHFKQELHQIGQHLKDQTSHLLVNVAHEFEHGAKAKIEEVFEKLIAEVLEGLAKEIVETIVVMTAGAAVTTSLSVPIPIVQILGVIKVELELLNHILDMIEAGLEVVHGAAHVLSFGLF